MYIYIYKICIYFTYIKYIYIHIYVSIFVSLPAKTGYKREPSIYSIRRVPGNIIMEAFESEFGPFSLKRRLIFSAFSSQEGVPVPQTPLRARSIRPALAKLPHRSWLWSYLVSVEGPLVIFPLKTKKCPHKTVLEGWVAGTCTVQLPTLWNRLKRESFK